MFRCVYCESQYTFTPRQITEIRKMNQPAPRDPDIRAGLVREILRRLRGCRESADVR